MAGEKTEKATPKRKQEERKKGNIFQSKEVITVFSLVIVFYLFQLLAPTTFSAIKSSITTFLDSAATLTELNEEVMNRMFIESATTFAIAAMPIVVCGAAAAVILTGVQTRFLTSFTQIKPKGSRINPISGFKKMFSIRGVVELVKSLIKIVILVVICYNNIIANMSTIPNMMDMEITQSFNTTGEIIMSIVNGIVPIFVFVAMADYVYQWWEYEKNLRMSKQEIKEEYKQTEGDPQIKGKIREKQNAAARKRMMQAVPTADVIIRNPTHFAVAIKYDPELGNAPVVVAKGADRIALKIVEIAQENDVMTVENKPLARSLYDQVEVNWEIPPDLYQAVAEVIAFVYSVKERNLPTVGGS